MKYAFIQSKSETYPVIRLCDALGVSASGYYDWVNRVPSERAHANQALLNKVRALYTQHKGRYGSPRIHAELKRQGETASEGRIARLMKRHNIQANRAKRHKRVYFQREQQQAAPNHLARDFRAVAPNEKWVSDITFIETREGFVYLAIVLDLYSRAVIGWAMSHRINGQLVLDALNMAIAHRGKPKRVLVHSDQGSQYTAQLYRDLLSNYSMICSMSRKGECHDNAVAESFFRTVKEELVKENLFQTRQQAIQSLFEYIEVYYNRQRLHSTLNYETPLQYERMQNVA